jgi:hypothetical protein
MRALKSVVLVVGLLVLTQYVPPIYYAMEFNDFVKNEPLRTPERTNLRSRLLQQAQWYLLPIKSDDIRINDDGGLIRVKVDYKIPVNLFIFTHELSFHAGGAGLPIHQ